MNITLLMPTRGRPHYLDRVYESALDMADNPSEIEFSFYVDNDDAASQNKINTFVNSHITIGERIVLSQMWNEAYKKATADIFMHSGDDIIFRTKHWDTQVIEAFNQYPDKIVFVGGNDMSGVHDGKFFTHGFLHRNWVSVIGYFVPPFYVSDYNDTHLNEVARLINRWHYISEFNIEHMHPNFGKGPTDQTHLDRIKRHYESSVAELYDKLFYTRKEDAEKLSQFIINYGVNND